MRSARVYLSIAIFYLLSIYNVTGQTYLEWAPQEGIIKKITWVKIKHHNKDTFIAHSLTRYDPEGFISEYTEYDTSPTGNHEVLFSAKYSNIYSKSKDTGDKQDISVSSIEEIVFPNPYNPDSIANYRTNSFGKNGAPNFPTLIVFPEYGDSQCTIRLYDGNVPADTSLACPPVTKAIYSRLFHTGKYNINITIEGRGKFAEISYTDSLPGSYSMRVAYDKKDQDRMSESLFTSISNEYTRALHNPYKSGGALLDGYFRQYIERVSHNTTNKTEDTITTMLPLPDSEVVMTLNEGDKFLFKIYREDGVGGGRIVGGDSLTRIVDIKEGDIISLKCYDTSNLLKWESLNRIHKISGQSTYRVTFQKEISITASMYKAMGDFPNLFYHKEYYYNGDGELIQTNTNFWPREGMVRGLNNNQQETITKYYRTNKQKTVPDNGTVIYIEND